MPKIEITADGSHTLFSEMAGQTYHSSHGAIQESQYIFIDMGLKKAQLDVCLDQQDIVEAEKEATLAILEIGFGTGLNALLSAKFAFENRIKIDYTTIELYPLEVDVYKELNYGKLLENEKLFLNLHATEWNSDFVEVTPSFSIRKYKRDILDVLNKFEIDICGYDVVYFDPFSPEAQPELWTESVFVNIYRLMNSGGVLTTYCAKGDVRRAMLAAGFKVEKLQGPPGKRHILRAIKP